MINALNPIRFSDTLLGRVIYICVIVIVTTTLAIQMQAMKAPPAEEAVRTENVGSSLEDNANTDSVEPSNNASATLGTARTLAAPVVVLEGDTLLLGSISVQIANLDCATTATTHGALAAEEAFFIVKEKELICDLQGRMAGNHEIGTCLLPDGRDFGDAMTSAGVCALSSW